MILGYQTIDPLKADIASAAKSCNFNLRIIFEYIYWVKEVIKSDFKNVELLF